MSLGKYSLGALLCATSIFSAAESPSYEGQQQRTIKSFSQSDVEALLEGRDWGFAKAAKLNGFPGPLHVLENDEALGLDERQRHRYVVLRGYAVGAAHEHSGTAQSH